MRRVAPTAPQPRWVRDVAELLALGYVRFRKREAARMARASSVGSASNPLDEVAHRAFMATGERRTETGNRR